MDERNGFHFGNDDDHRNMIMQILDWKAWPLLRIRCSRFQIEKRSAKSVALPSSFVIRHSSFSSSGAVLIVVLVVCLGLVSLTLVFGHSMLMAYRGSDNAIAGRQAEQALEGAARYAESLMANVDQPGDLPDITSYPSEAVPIGDETFWFIGKPLPNDPVTEPAFGLVDEASKLNLNTASVEMLAALPGMTAEFAASIKDWRDADDDVTPGGAESASYLLSKPSYACKNAKFESLEELALVYGADATILYGEDANMNHVLDPNENDGEQNPPWDNADGKLDAGIFEYVTVFSREPNKLPDGTAKANVTAGGGAVAALLRTTFGDSRGAEIDRRVTAGGRARSVLEFFIKSGMTEEEFTKISPSLTMKGGDYAEGLVNVNTASEQVLACIPGIADKASQLVAARQGQSQPPATISWVVPILGPAASIQAGPWLTTKSYQISADIAAVGHHGRGYRRALFVIDTSATGTPQIVYRRNMAPLGWALGSNARDTFATKKDAP